MDLQQALDLMRRVKAGPRVSQDSHPSRYSAWVITEDGERFSVQVLHHGEAAFDLEDAAEAREWGFLWAYPPVTPAADPFVLAMACPLCRHATRPRRVRPLNRVLIRGDFSCQRCETTWQASRSWPLTNSAWLLDETSVDFGYRRPASLR